LFKLIGFLPYFEHGIVILRRALAGPSKHLLCLTDA
jgi:hypothetical protein